MKKYWKQGLLSLAVLGAVACSHNPQPMGKPLPVLTYENLQPYDVQGGTTMITQSYIPDAKTLETVKAFPISPADLLRRYAQHRFVTGAAQSKLIFDIVEASLKKTEDKDNIVGFISGRAEEHYTMTMIVHLTPIRQDGKKSDPSVIRLTRYLSFSQNMTLAEREFAQFEMLEQAIHQIDERVTDIVANKLTENFF